MPIPKKEESKTTDTRLFNPRGMRRFNLNFDGYEKALNVLIEKQDKQEDLWVKANMTALYKDMETYFHEASLQPSPNAMEDFQKVWEEKYNGILDRAPSEKSKDKFFTASRGLEENSFGRSLKLVGAANTLGAVQNISSMMTDIEDMAVNSRNPDMFIMGRLSVTEAITENTGVLFDPITAEKLNEAASTMTVNTVKLWAQDDPDAAKQLLDKTEGLSGSVRANLLKEINAIKKQGAQVDRALLEQDKQSFLSSLEEHGSGSFDEDAWLNSLPAEQRVGARTLFNREVYIALGAHGFKQDIAGATPAEIMQKTEALKPKAGEVNHHNKMSLYNHARNIATERIKEIENNPYAAAARSPVIKQLEESMASLPDEEKARGLGELIAANLAIQADMGVPQNMRKVASTEELKKHAANINAGSAKDSLDRMGQLSQIYGDYYPVLFRNMQELPSGERVNSELSIAYEHMSDGNIPPWLYNFIDASRMSVKELGFTEADHKTFLDKAGKKTFEDLRNAMWGAGGSASIVRATEVQEAIAKYAMFLCNTSVQAGGIGERNAAKAAEAARKHIIDSIFAFGEANGQKYTIPRKQGNYTIDDRTARQIDSTLSFFLDMSADIPLDQQPVFGREEDPITYNPRPFLPGMISLEKNEWGSTKHLSKENQRDFIAWQIDTYGYWAESKDGKGVTLMSRQTSDRNVPVLNNKGEPITVSFTDVIAWSNRNREVRLIKEAQNNNNSIYWNTSTGGL